jgi:integrase
VQTGLRVSELIGLTCQDIVLGTGAHVHCQGKGRKHRCTPLRPETAKMLEAWMRERHDRPDDPLLPASEAESSAAMPLNAWWRNTSPSPPKNANLSSGST